MDQDKSNYSDTSRFAKTTSARETEIPHLISQIDSIAENILNRVYSFNDRISPILRPELSDGDDSELEKGTNTIIGESLRVILTKLEKVDGVINSMQNRLEI